LTWKLSTSIIEARNISSSNKQEGEIMRFFGRLLGGALLCAASLGLAGAAWAEHAGAPGTDQTVTYKPDVTFTLRTSISGGKLVFIGDRGAIADAVNPDLKVPEGAVVQINLVNGDGATHDIAVPDFHAHSDQISGKNAATAIVFRASKNGTYEYLCTLPGHKAAGMVGKLIVGEPAQEARIEAPQIAHDPSIVGTPVGKRGPQKVTVDLLTTEVEGRLGDNSTYRFWTFNNKVPGPFIRVRVGDTVTVNVSNAKDSTHIHSVDFHAVTGPGGGAAVTQVPPGQTKSFSFKARHPGLFVYHCATPMVAQHITNGMYGMILVEPEGGLPKVDREFYVMQGELYTAEPFGSQGELTESYADLLDERPSYFLFNGAVGALTEEAPLTAKVGERVRIYFGVGGPNKTSSFHVIGEIFDSVYPMGSLSSDPVSDVQTVTVAPGGAVAVDVSFEVPGTYALVDHALSRVEKGLVGHIKVDGPDNPEVFRDYEQISQR
jgi:nitrite reductase (NO-forming)